MPLRLCFIGDSITVGTGDDAFLGWPGRLCAAARSQGCDLTLYNLGIRGETSEDIRRRWRQEAERRLPATMNCALVFAFGINDCAVENGVKLRVELEQTVVNARAILNEAKAWLPAIFVISDRAVSRTPGRSSDTNHWSTARKMIGVLERQQCG